MLVNTTSIVVDIVTAVGLELVLARVSLEPVVTLALPFVSLPRGAISVAAAVVSAALTQEVSNLMDIFMNYELMRILTLLHISTG